MLIPHMDTFIQRGASQRDMKCLTVTCAILVWLQFTFTGNPSKKNPLNVELFWRNVNIYLLHPHHWCELKFILVKIIITLSFIICHAWCYNGTSHSPRFNIKSVFPGMGISIINIRRSWDCLIYIMGIPLLARRYLYIEKAQRFVSSSQTTTWLHILANGSTAFKWKLCYDWLKVLQ